LIPAMDEPPHGVWRTRGGVRTTATKFEGSDRQSTAGNSPVQSPTHGETHRAEIVDATAVYTKPAGGAAFSPSLLDFSLCCAAPRRLSRKTPQAPDFILRLARNSTEIRISRWFCFRQTRRWRGGFLFPPNAPMAWRGYDRRFSPYSGRGLCESVRPQGCPGRQPKRGRRRAAGNRLGSFRLQWIRLGLSC
jgi:hypothetical protein